MSCAGQPVTGLHELQAFQGVVLPGGSSMAAVNGQIRVAEETWPAGSQRWGCAWECSSMMTAAVRRSPGFESAIPAEVAPDEACTALFPLPMAVIAAAYSLFPPGLSPAISAKCTTNHRYCFNPELLRAVSRRGQVSAQSDGIVEAVSQPELPFWHGVQGHPELMSRPDAPHPLFVAFLQAALNAPA